MLSPVFHGAAAGPGGDRRWIFSDFVDGVTCDDVREMERRMIEEHLADAAKEESLDANPED